MEEPTAICCPALIHASRTPRRASIICPRRGGRKKVVCASFFLRSLYRESCRRGGAQRALCARRRACVRRVRVQQRVKEVCGSCCFFFLPFFCLFAIFLFFFLLPSTFSSPPLLPPCCCHKPPRLPSLRRAPPLPSACLLLRGAAPRYHVSSTPAHSTPRHYAR